MSHRFLWYNAAAHSHSCSCSAFTDNCACAECFHINGSTRAFVRRGSYFCGKHKLSCLPFLISCDSFFVSLPIISVKEKRLRLDMCTGFVFGLLSILWSEFKKQPQSTRGRCRRRSRRIQIWWRRRSAFRSWPQRKSRSMTHNAGAVPAVVPQNLIVSSPRHDGSTIPSVQ